MKTYSSNILFSLFIIIILVSSSCREIIPIEIEDSDRKIVLNALVSEDGLEARASLSLGINDRNENVIFINDAILTLYKNDEEQGNLIANPIDNKGHFIMPGFIPEAGANYTLTVDKSPYESVYASCQIPASSAIDTIYYQEENLSDFGYTYTVFSFFITIDDSKDEENFYFISDSATYKYTYFDYDLQKDTTFSYTESYYMQSNDPIIGSNDYSNRMLFSDELFNGQKRAVKVSIDEYAFYNDTTILDFYLYSITKDYYLFLKSKELQMQSDEFARLLGATPVQVYNNVEGGYGYFGGYSYSKKTIRIEGIYRDDYNW